MGSVARKIVSACLLVFSFGAAQGADDGCALPSGLRTEVAKRYPNERVVRSSDLSDSNKDILKQEPPGSCPGLIKLDFYGDKKPTWAVLLTGLGKKAGTQFIVARETGAAWEIKAIESLGSDSDMPIIWEQDPGEYTDVYGEKTIRAKSAVIVLWVDSSVAMLYAWSGKEVEKIWIRD
jgi:hypothetical protein